MQLLKQLGSYIFLQPQVAVSPSVLFTVCLWVRLCELNSRTEIHQPSRLDSPSLFHPLFCNHQYQCYKAIYFSLQILSEWSWDTYKTLGYPDCGVFVCFLCCIFSFSSYFEKVTWQSGFLTWVLNILFSSTSKWIYHFSFCIYECYWSAIVWPPIGFSPLFSCLFMIAL